MPPDPEVARTPLDVQVGELLVANDEAAAASEVIRALGPRVRGYLRAVLRDDDDAEDAFSLFSEWVWKSIGTLREASSLRTWTFGVACNAARRIREDPYRRRREHLPTEAASKLPRNSTRSSRMRKQIQLDEIRASLEPEEQNLLVLRLDQALEWEEIAHVLAAAGTPCTAAALRKRFERLKERIGALARQRGLLG